MRLSVRVFCCLALPVLLGCRISTRREPAPGPPPEPREIGPGAVELTDVPVDLRAPPPPLFVNVTAELGLSGVRAKDCILTDLNRDGWWDLVLDRRRLYLNQQGTGFWEFENSGLDFPVLRIVPLTADGKPDEEKAKEREYVPQYLSFGDIDNDGDPDAIWGVKCTWEHFDGESFHMVEACDPGVRTRVYLNKGDGRFMRAPRSAFTDTRSLGPAMAAAFVDTDRDGMLDIYEGREYRRYGVLYGCGVDRLWRGLGAGMFEDVTERSGLLTVPEPGGPRSSRPSYGVAHGDMDNDGLQDLLQLAYGRQWNYQWRARPDGTFEDVGMKTGFSGDAITHGRYPDWVKERMNRPDEEPFRANGNTFDCAVADFDNDGDLDCFLGEITHRWAGESSDLPSLLVNQGAAGGWRFERRPVTEFLPPRKFRGDQWNYGDLHAAWLDYDNDTLQDLLIASGDYPDGQFLRLYRQLPDHTFVEVTEQAGFAWEGAGGLSVGDFDRDGDVDIVVGRSFMRLNQKHRDKHMDGITVNEVGIFRNDAANRGGNHWLNVRLEGKGEGHANRSGIGARILVSTGVLTQTREIRGGSGLANHQDPPEACFGLGSATRVDRLVIRWPDKASTVQVFLDVPADRFLTIVQGDATPRIDSAQR